MTKPLLAEPPKEPRISEKQCVISDTSAYIELSYNVTVRATQMMLHYQESLFKGLSEKDWQQVKVCACMLCGTYAGNFVSRFRPRTMYHK